MLINSWPPISSNIRSLITSIGTCSSLNKTVSIGAVLTGGATTAATTAGDTVAGVAGVGVGCGCGFNKLLCLFNTCFVKLEPFLAKLFFKLNKTFFNFNMNLIWLKIIYNLENKKFKMYKIY